MFQPQENPHSTPEEYLALEEQVNYHNEYYQGEIFAMSGGSANHNRLIGGVYTILNAAFPDRWCEVFMSDMRLLVKKNDLYTYPDLMVICGKPKFVKGRTDTLTNPIVIIEVLSKSTEGYDRGTKFELYRALKSFQDYVLIAQNKIHIDHFHKLEDGRWVLQEFNHLEDGLVLETIGVELPLAQIYQKVNWDEVERD